MNDLSLDAKLRGSAATKDEPVVQSAVDVVSPEYRAKVQEVAEKFEGFFIAQMLHQMRESTRQMSDEDSVFNKRINQDMLDLADTAFADGLAGQRAFGIADAILKQMLPATQTVGDAAGLKNVPVPVASKD